jgi:hypothetical protein
MDRATAFRMKLATTKLPSVRLTGVANSEHAFSNVVSADLFTHRNGNNASGCAGSIRPVGLGAALFLPKFGL